MSDAPQEPRELASDAALARAVAAGAGSAAEAALVARFSRRVFLYGMRHLREEAQAHDLAQEVMTLVLTKLRAGEVREPERIGSFVLGTARLTARALKRDAHRHREVAQAAASEESTTVAAREGGDRERLARALGTLSERERAVVVWTFFEDRSAQDIGAALGLTAGNVRVIRHRAVARLAQSLGVGSLVGQGGLP